jgi:hypothetical protein
MGRSAPTPRGRLRLTVRAPGGAVIARREALNIVVRDGARLVARLFSGAEGATPVDRIRVGFALEGGNPELNALANPDNLPATVLESLLPAEAFTIRDDAPDLVSVMVRARFQLAVDLAQVTEAGLFGGDTLYNQVVFEPLDLRVGQDITFFWEIEFPFGR